MEPIPLKNALWSSLLMFVVVVEVIFSATARVVISVSHPWCQTSSLSSLLVIFVVVVIDLVVIATADPGG